MNRTAGLMGLVVFCAVSLAALREPNSLSVAGMRLLTFGAIGCSILAILYRDGERRAAFVGFTIFAAGFWLLPVFPNMLDENPMSQVMRCQGTIVAGVIGAFLARKLYKTRGGGEGTG